MAIFQSCNALLVRFSTCLHFLVAVAVELEDAEWREIIIIRNIYWYINIYIDNSPIKVVFTFSNGNFSQVIAINLTLFFRMGFSLHYHGHSHGDKGHSHEENINVRAAFIHVLGDFIQSFGVFVAALIIYFEVEPLQWAK